MEWKVFTPITDAAVPLVPIQRTLIFDSIPEIALIYVLFPVLGTPVIRIMKGSSI